MTDGEDSSRRLLVMHVGLPKAGSTALQYWCENNKSQLGSRGVDYPWPRVKRFQNPLIKDVSPKHGFLVQSLKNGDMQPFHDLAHRNFSKKMLVSSEGFTNHFYSFDPDDLKKARLIFGQFEMRVLMLTRAPDKWKKSMWKEGVLDNPGTVLPFEEFCKLDQIVRLSDFEQLARDIANGYGADEVVQAPIEQNGWRKPLLDTLEIEDSEDFLLEENKNVSVSDDLIEVIQGINRQRLRPFLRLLFLGVVQRRFQTTHNRLEIAGEVRPPGVKECMEISDALHKVANHSPETAGVVELLIGELGSLSDQKDNRMS